MNAYEEGLQQQQEQQVNLQLQNEERLYRESDPLLANNQNNDNHDRLSNYSGRLGQGQNFQELRRQRTNVEVDNIKRDIIADLIFIAIIIVLTLHIGSGATCGIPILKWIMVYFSILGLRSASNLLRIYMIRNQFYQEQTNNFTILSFIVIDGFILGWLIYGNILFFSKNNNCYQLQDSRMLYDMMLILLIFGYFQMLVYAVIILMLPCIIYQLRNQHRGRNDLSDQAIPNVIQNLTRLKFKTDQFTNENVCSICFVDYNNDDDVTPLSCNPGHYFHTACIEDWIKIGKNSCPLCRSPIQQIS
eukprot:403364024